MSTTSPRRALIALAALGLAMMCGCAVPTTSSGPTITVTTTPPAVTVTLVVEVTGSAETIAVNTSPTAAAAAFRDGQHIVGRDIEPGTYRASAGGDICYWERQEQDGELIANGFGTVATIRSSDYSFQSNRCGSWSPGGVGSRWRGTRPPAHIFCRANTFRCTWRSARNDTNGIVPAINTQMVPSGDQRSL